jgi:SAM-dependent methyltransferase
VIGDFGCGECLLAKALGRPVIGLDHIAMDGTVTVYDMAHTPLDNGSLDAAVFSLSLMGTNWRDYLREAQRVLKPYGHLFIAETQRGWGEDFRELVVGVGAAGFKVVGEPESRGDFVYVSAVKAN